MGSFVIHQVAIQIKMFPMVHVRLYFSRPFIKFTENTNDVHVLHCTVESIR